MSAAGSQRHTHTIVSTDWPKVLIFAIFVVTERAHIATTRRTTMAASFDFCAAPLYGAAFLFVSTKRGIENVRRF